MRSYCSSGWVGSKLVLDSRWLGLEGTHYIDRLAERWKACAAIYLSQRETLALLRYEDFVVDKAGEIERLAARLQLEGGRDIRDHVDRPFQPRGHRSNDWPAFFGEENLLRIERICAQSMRELGYPLTSRDDSARQ